MKKKQKRRPLAKKRSAGPECPASECYQTFEMNPAPILLLIKLFRKSRREEQLPNSFCKANIT